MGKHYRPFTLAKAGEFAGLTRLGTPGRGNVTPVFRIPAREWDYDKGSFSKTETAHVETVTKKLVAAWGGSAGYVDLSLFGSDAAIHGVHPLRYVVETAATGGVNLMPLVRPDSSAAFVTEAAAIQRERSGGVGVHLEEDYWLTVDPSALPALLSSLGVAPSVVDVMVDYRTGSGALVRVAVDGEVNALERLGGFRSITVGGSAFPALTSAARGTSEFDRDDWLTYESVQAVRAGREDSTPDYLDHIIVCPDLIDQQVDPRVLSISAMLRYTVTEKWLIAKGALFKGGKPRPGVLTGGAALIAPLQVLRTHPDFATPIRTQTDDWIDAVVAGTTTPGNPTKWREWGTLRHIEVTLHQLSTLA
ncbi:beta family protein [Microbacterium sp. A1-JK]|uniref:beta family protein n=1 Tax=Microbacterium sp. A1-JK TaxID=3177516 RepID=UPI0038847412